VTRVEDLDLILDRAMRRPQRILTRSISEAKALRMALWRRKGRRAVRIAREDCVVRVAYSDPIVRVDEEPEGAVR
jgi:hypothetical protein